MRIFQKWNTVLSSHLAENLKCFVNTISAWCPHTLLFLQHLDTCCIIVCSNFEVYWVSCRIAVPSRTYVLHLPGNFRKRFEQDMAAPKTWNNYAVYSNLIRFAHIVYRWKGIYEGFQRELELEENMFICLINYRNTWPLLKNTNTSTEIWNVHPNTPNLVAWLTFVPSIELHHR